MRLRAVHIACLLLLLSSLGATEGAVLQGRDLCRGRGYVSMMEQTAGVATAATPLQRSLHISSETVTTASSAPHLSAWSMRPPAAHAAAVQTSTSLLS